MKLYADRKRTEREFEVGEWVYLRLQPYCQKSVAICNNLKLSPKFYGPFRVVQQVGLVAYRLDLPSTSRIHLVFHVFCLKKKLGANINPLPTLPPVSSQGGIMPEPESIVDRRLKKLGQRAIIEVLIKWVGENTKDNS